MRYMFLFIFRMKSHRSVKIQLLFSVIQQCKQQQLKLLKLKNLRYKNILSLCSLTHYCHYFSFFAQEISFHMFHIFFIPPSRVEIKKENKGRQREERKDNQRKKEEKEDRTTGSRDKCWTYFWTLCKWCLAFYGPRWFNYTRREFRFLFLNGKSFHTNVIYMKLDNRDTPFMYFYISKFKKVSIQMSLILYWIIEVMVISYFLLTALRTLLDPLWRY